MACPGFGPDPPTGSGRSGSGIATLSLYINRYLFSFSILL